MWFVVLLVAVESHPRFHDDVDEASSTTASSQGDRQLRRMLVRTAARTNPGRRPPPQPLPLPSTSSVQLVGVDVRRIQRKAGVTTSDLADNATNSASDVDTTLADQLRLARIR